MSQKCPVLRRAFTLRRGWDSNLRTWPAKTTLHLIIPRYIRPGASPALSSGAPVPSLPLVYLSLSRLKWGTRCRRYCSGALSSGAPVPPRGDRLVYPSKDRRVQPFMDRRVKKPVPQRVLRGIPCGRLVPGGRIIFAQRVGFKPTKPLVGVLTQVDGHNRGCSFTL